MATATKPPIFATAIQGWRSTFEAISRMSALFITATVLMLILNAVSIPLAPAPKQEPSLAISIADVCLGDRAGIGADAGCDRDAPFRAAG